MRAFKDFLRWYKNKEVVLTLEARKKIVGLYRIKGIDMLKLGCNLPNLAKICLHKSTTAKTRPVTESDKDFLEKIRVDKVDQPTIVFRRIAVVDEIFFGIRPTGASPSLEVMLISFIFSLCVQLNQLVSTRDGN